MILQMLSEKTPARVKEIGCGVWRQVRGWKWGVVCGDGCGGGNGVWCVVTGARITPTPTAAANFLPKQFP